MCIRDSRCIELGADDYVTKPFDKTILEARISACIEKKQLRDKEKELLEEIRKEKDKSDRLLLNILPKNIETFIWVHDIPPVVCYLFKNVSTNLGITDLLPTC